MDLKKVKIVSKKSIGIEPVYDICVPDQHHYILDNGVVSHNSGFIYASSIVVAMQKLKLKEDEDGNKVTEVNGIRSACKIMKTRYAKPFEDIQVKIPYSTGMSPYSGMVDMLEKKGVLTKDGNSLKYVTTDGEIIKKFRKAWEKNDSGCLDTIMREYKEPAKTVPTSENEEDTDTTGETEE